MDYQQKLKNYIRYCEQQKRLIENMVKSYRIAITQLLVFIDNNHHYLESVSCRFHSALQRPVLEKHASKQDMKQHLFLLW